MKEKRLSTAIHEVTTPAGDPAWLVTNYDEVKALLADPRLGDSHADPERAPRESQAIFRSPIGHPSTEDAEHTRMRRLLAPAFSARRIARLQPRVAAIIADLLDAMAARTPPVDFHQAVSFPLPSLVICELLDVPDTDREDFRSWSDDAAHPSDAARSQAAQERLYAYMRAVVERKQAQPGEDLVSDLVAAAADDPDLTIDTIVMLGASLLYNGHGPTMVMIDRGVTLLLTHPEQADALRHDPALVAPAVEEILRLRKYHRQSMGIPRYANTDFTFGGVSIRTGELVILGVSAANRDERHFSEPDRFDVYRKPNPHLAFGHGPRICVGAPLARLELQMLVPALLHRFPTLRLAVAAESLRERAEVVTGGVMELPVTW
jgi:cytochrome P450